MEKNKQKLLILAWIASLLATIGSLYFSEIKGFIPCTLCWIQRIFMYPIPIILGIGLLKKDNNIGSYILPLAAIGSLFSTYQYLYQKTDWFDKIQSCTVGVPCNFEYINWFGFITIPFLALTAFLIIITSILFSNK